LNCLISLSSIIELVSSCEAQEENEDDEIEISESLRFNFDTIRDATNDFVESNKLGQGGFGIVYKVR
jgi:hypothetical protein